MIGRGSAWAVHKVSGARLVCREDGKLAFAEANCQNAVNIVALGGGLGGACLFEAPGRRIRLRNDGLGTVILPLMLTASGLSTTSDGEALRLSKTGAIEVFSGSGGEPFRLQLEPLSSLPPHVLLSKIPSDLLVDAHGLNIVVETGNADLVPIAEAMLEIMNVSSGRAAWNAKPRGASQDKFHELFRNQGRRELARFTGYTADILRNQSARYGWSIGSNSYGNPKILESGRGGSLTIGRYCSIADPIIILANHGTNAVSTYPFMDLWADWPGTVVGLTDHVARDVTIGNDVWIGAGAILLPGARVGDGAIVGAGSVIRGDVPPYAVCAGNPCNVYRYRFDPAVIARLLRLRWWDWSDCIVDRFIPLLLSGPVEAFLTEAEKEEIPQSS